MTEKEKANDTISVSMSSTTVLVLGILLASLIVSASILLASNAVADKLTPATGAVVLGGSDAAANQGAQAAPTPNTAPTPTPSPTPTGGTAKMADLMQNAAGTLGDPNAPVVIVEFSDYQCPFCRRWVENSKPQLEQNYIDTGKVRLLYKDFPLSFHPMSKTYANAARCAGDQGKYWEMHDKIFAEQAKFGSGTVSSITLADVKNWASDLGLDTGAFNSCADSDKYATEVQANFREGGQAGVSGTPSFFIGTADGTGQLVVGAQPYATFQAAIDALLS